MYVTRVPNRSSSLAILLREGFRIYHWTARSFRRMT